MWAKGDVLGVMGGTDDSSPSSEHTSFWKIRSNTKVLTFTASNESPLLSISEWLIRVTLRAAVFH